MATLGEVEQCYTQARAWLFQGKFNSVKQDRVHSVLEASDRKQEVIPTITKDCKWKAEAETENYPRALVRNTKWY